MRGEDAGQPEGGQAGVVQENGRLAVMAQQRDGFAQGRALEDQAVVFPGHRRGGIDLGQRHQLPANGIDLLARQEHDWRLRRSRGADLHPATLQGHADVVVQAAHVEPGAEHADVGRTRGHHEGPIARRGYLEKHLPRAQRDPAAERVPTDLDLAAAVEQELAAVGQGHVAPLTDGGGEALALVGRVQPGQGADGQRQQ